MKSRFNACLKTENNYMPLFCYVHIYKSMHGPKAFLYIYITHDAKSLYHNIL